MLKYYLQGHYHRKSGKPSINYYSSLFGEIVWAAEGNEFLQELLQKEDTFVVGNYFFKVRDTRKKCWKFLENINLLCLLGWI